MGRHDANKTASGSHVNYQYLSTPEKAQQLQRMHCELRCNVWKERLRAQLERVVEEEGVSADTETHEDICAIMDSQELP